MKCKWLVTGGALCLISQTMVAGSVTINDSRAIKIDASASSGLNGGIYVVPSTSGVTLTYRSDGAGANVTWERFGAMGAAHGEVVAPASVGANQSTIALGSDDCGYTITDGSSMTFVWVVNYANHPLSLTGISFPAEQECDRATLMLEGTGDRITYYTINGAAIELSRELQLAYQTLEFNADDRRYQPVETSQSVAYLHRVSVPAPLCDTDFELTGDRFTRQWGHEQTVASDVMRARSITAETSAIQAERDVPNEQKESRTELGGSAPCEITFEAVVTDGAVFREWQMSDSPEFDILELSYNELDFTYTFREQGTMYVRFVAADDSGECEYMGPTYEVFIGESDIKCPNAFSPGTSPGVNDEWRVSYKSLISYECHIFNKWGQELFSSTDPSVGWDGRKGKGYVPAGTYYYVIVAEGSDGKKYKLAGDINVVGFHSASGSSSTPVEE